MFNIPSNGFHIANKMDQQMGEHNDLPPRQGIRGYRNSQPVSIKGAATGSVKDSSLHWGKRDNHVLPRQNLLDLFKGKGKGKGKFTPPPFLTPTFPFIQLPPGNTDVPTTSESSFTESSTSTTAIETPTPAVGFTTIIVSEPVPTSTLSPLPVDLSTIAPVDSTTDPTTVQTLVPITGPTAGQTTTPVTIDTAVPSTVPTTDTELSSTFSTFTVSTMTLSTTATIWDTPYATYSATQAPMEYTLRPGHIAGIVLGTILGVVLVITLALLHFWKRRQMTAYGAAPSSGTIGESRFQSSACLGVGSSVDHSAQLWIPESVRPKTSRLGWMYQLKHKIPRITLPPVAGENEKQASNRSIGKQSARSIVSQLFSRQPSPQPSPQPSSNGEPSGIGAAGSGRGTPFRNSTISEESSTWMTTTTQRDSTFVPPTALSHPSIPPKARQILNMPEEGAVRAGGPSRWLSPPSWRVSRSRRSLARKTFNGGNHSPSRLSRNPFTGFEYLPSPPSASDSSEKDRTGSDRSKPDTRGQR